MCLLGSAGDGRAEAGRPQVIRLCPAARCTLHTHLSARVRAARTRPRFTSGSRASTEAVSQNTKVQPLPLFGAAAFPPRRRWNGRLGRHGSGRNSSGKLFPRPGELGNHWPYLQLLWKCNCLKLQVASSAESLCETSDVPSQRLSSLWTIETEPFSNISPKRF